MEQKLLKLGLTATALGLVGWEARRRGERSPFYTHVWRDGGIVSERGDGGSSQAYALRTYLQVLHEIPHVISITDESGEEAQLLFKPRESHLSLYTLWNENEEWYEHEPRFTLVWQGKKGRLRVKAEVWLSFSPNTSIHVGGRLGGIEVDDDWSVWQPLTTPPRWAIDREVGPGSFFTVFRDEGVEVDWNDPRNQSRSRAKRAAIAAKNIHTGPRR